MSLIYGHRGASAAAPENTIEAFVLARRMGADGVELDVRRSADGALVLHHDAALPDGRLVQSVAGADLPASVPTLAAALDACRGLVVNIEIKNIPGEPDFDPGRAVADQVVSLLADRDGDDVLISSFHLPTIDRVKELAPGLRTGLLTFFEPPPLDSVPEVVGRGHDAIHPFDYTVDGVLVDRAHGAGLEVNVWTVDDPGRIEQLAAFGVDGIVTNVPDVALRALRPGRDGGRSGGDDES